MMQDPPAVDQIELAEFGEERRIKRRAPHDLPIFGIRRVTPTQFLGAGYRIAVVVEGHDIGSELVHHQARKAAAGADVKRADAVQVVFPQRLAQSAPGFLDSAFVQRGEKRPPVAAKRKPQFRIFVTGRLGGRTHLTILPVRQRHADIGSTLVIHWSDLSCQSAAGVHGCCCPVGRRY